MIHLREDLAKISLKEIENFFEKEKLHRFNKIQAKCFYDAIRLIKNKYEGNASNI